MDTEFDRSQIGRVELLGLSPSDFRKFLIEEGYCTELEIRFNPAIVVELMSSEIWMEYEEMAEDRYQTMRQDERFRWADQ